MKILILDSRILPVICWFQQWFLYRAIDMIQNDVGPLKIFLLCIVMN